MDFFTVPTVSLRMLYVLFVIKHGRRRIVYFSVTSNPTSVRVIQQLREAFPYATAPRHLTFDRDTIFSPAVVGFVRAMGNRPARTACRCPWQNPVVECWIGSCRRELFQHVVVLEEPHLVRLIRSYLEYYHGDRSHLGLGKDAPNRRAVTQRPSATAKVVALPRAGGLHHRYEWRVAA
ncbi:MAG: transposase family protein [Sulfitobacter sp.]|nr:transposase family protein [Sulfitobacter sp.]